MLRGISWEEHLFRPNSEAPLHLAKMREALTLEAKEVLPRMLWMQAVEESAGYSPG